MKELKYLNKYFKKYRSKLFIGILVTIIARVFSLVLPPYISKTIAVVENAVSKGNYEVNELKRTLIIYIVIILVSTLLSGLFTFIMRQIIINISRYIEFDLKNEIFKQYERLSLTFYKKNRTGDLMNRISEDVSQVRMYAGPALMYTIQTITLFIFVIPMMFYKSPVMALYTLLPLPLLSFLIYKISKVIHHKSTDVQQFLSELSTFSQESFSGISVIKAYGIEPRINRELGVLAEKGKEKSMNLAKVDAWFFPLMIMLIGMSSIITIYVGGKQYIDGSIDSIGVIAEFIIYINMLTWPVATVGWVTSIVQRAEASQKRINEFLNSIPDIQNAARAKKQEIKGKITFKNVSLTYEDTHITALQNISFTLHPGETLAIIGKTGSGKSSVLDLIGRLYDATEGMVLVDDIPVKEWDMHSLRNAMGVVPQDAFLFSDTIKNNIRFGKEDATDDEIIAAARMAAVHETIMSFTQTYDTLLGERGITLSGGQKQRIAIARALIKEPVIYLFDDCLSAVDTETEEVILKNLAEAVKKKTTIIVSHRISSVKNADRIIVLEHGKIAEEGTHSGLLEAGGMYYQLYHNQLSGKEI
jgi:ATP-binding cassette subfamily B multidrug efflux pump